MIVVQTHMLNITVSDKNKTFGILQLFIAAYVHTVEHTGFFLLKHPEDQLFAKKKIWNGLRTRANLRSHLFILVPTTFRRMTGFHTHIHIRSPRETYWEQEAHTRFERR